jgi:hypothetical protein
MTDLPDVYAKVVAKRPELAVKLDCYSLCHTAFAGWYWAMVPNGKINWTPREQEAEALILAHWLAALPRDHGLAKSQGGLAYWWFVIRIDAETCRVEMLGQLTDSPLAALAAFWEARP